MNQLSLDAIGISEGTDKTSLGHDYLRHYARLFAHLRNEPVNLLEIGIADGASLRTWARYFPAATVVGVDIREDCARFADGRVIVEIGSQSDPEFLARLAAERRFDIVIDDGSHRAADMIHTFDRMFPFLSPGGIYVIEDLYVHYGIWRTDWHPGGGVTAAEYFSGLARLVGADHVEPDSGVMAKYLASSIGRIEFIPRAVAIHKREQAGRRLDPAEIWHIVEQTNHPGNWLQLSTLLMNAGDLVRAEEAVTRALRITPRNIFFLHRLADLQARRGDFPAAVETARMAVRINPDDPGGKHQLADLEARQHGPATR